MSIRRPVLPLLFALAFGAQALVAAPPTEPAAKPTGFVDRGALQFNGVVLEQRAILAGGGMAETGRQPARIALTVGGYLEADPGTQFRVDVGDDGVVSVLVVRGLLTVETTGGKRMTAGRNSVFKLDEAAVSAGDGDEADFDDDK